MILVIFFFLFPYSTPCVRTRPPEEIFITSTGANLPGDDCTTCDVAEIQPDPVNGIIFVSDNLNEAGQCKQTLVGCLKVDGEFCDDVHMMATTPDGQFPIELDGDGATVASVINCAEDGTYSFSDTVTGITKLECKFETCTTSPCATCKLEPATIGLMPPGPRSIAETIDVTLDTGCRQTLVGCGLEDVTGCTSTEVQVLNPATGQWTTITSPGSTVGNAIGVLDCKPDVTYEAMGISAITQVRCFSECT